MTGPSIWRGRAFRLLFGSTTASSLGSAIYSLVLPLLAIDVLAATETEVGLLRSVQWVPFLFLAVPLGLLADRRSRRSIMLTADSMRALLLAFVVVLAAARWLNFSTLLAVALLVGCCAVAYELSFLSTIPDIVDTGNLQSANRATEIAQSGATTLGPLLAGALVAVWTSVGGLLVSVTGYAASFLLLMLNRWPERAVSTDQAERRSLAGLLLAGLRFVARSALIAPLVAHLGVKNVFLQAFQTAILVFMAQRLDLPSTLIGLVLAAQGVGFLIGASVSPHLSGRIGIGPVMVGSSLAGGVGMLLVSVPGFGAVLPAIGTCCVGFGMGLFNLQSIAVRQAITPAHLLGRVNAAVKIVSYTAMSLGAFLGGYLSTLTEPVLVILTCGIGSLLATLPLLARSVRLLREVPLE